MTVTGYISVDEIINSKYYCYFEQCCPSGISLTEMISGMIDEATVLIDNYLGYSLWNKSYRDIFRGRGGVYNGGSTLDNVYFTAHIPVTSLTSATWQNVRQPIYEATYSQGANATSGSLTNVLLIDERTGQIEFANVLDGYTRVTLNYYAGYNEIPDDIKTATKIMTVQLIQMIDTGNLSNPDVSYDNLKFGKTAFGFGSSKIVKNVSMLSMDDVNGLPIMVEKIVKKYKFSRMT